MHSTKRRRLRHVLRRPSVFLPVALWAFVCVGGASFAHAQEARTRDATSRDATSRGDGARRPGAAAPDAEGGGRSALGEGPSSAQESGIVAFVKRNASWLLGLLVVVLALVVAWAFMGGRSRSDPGAVSRPALPESHGVTPGTRRYSSTKIEVAEVNDRLGAKVTETQVETEREYALIVDEEALRVSAPREELDPRTGNAYAEDAEINRLLKEKHYREAYSEYARHIEQNGSLQFHREVEEVLGNYLLKIGDLDKAARVLEHHVATHDSRDVRADIYFNLGYIHFVKERPNKSRRFLKLFLESSKNRQHIERAQRILASIESAGAGK